MPGPNMAKKARQMRAGNRPEQKFETSSPQIGRHLSKLTGTGAKNRKAKIKGRGPMDARRRQINSFGGIGRVKSDSKGGSIRMPGGPASPETRSEQWIPSYFKNRHLWEGGKPR